MERMKIKTRNEFNSFVFGGPGHHDTRAAHSVWWGVLNVVYVPIRGPIIEAIHGDE